MKTKERYCRRCKRRTQHDLFRDEEGFGRAVLAIGTLGFSEVINYLHARCQRCGKEENLSLR